jgi:hypothetical protein
LETEENVEFDLQVQVNEWVRALPPAKESEADELKAHLWSLIDKLKEAGLDDEEAFLVATRRMGGLSELDIMYKEPNSSILQMKKTLIILGGVLFYNLVYYFLQFSSELLLIILLIFGIDGHIAIKCVAIYLEGFQFLFVLLAASIYFFDTKTITFIKKIKISPKHAVFLLITAVLFGIADTCLLPIARNLMKRGSPVSSQFNYIYFYFDYSFPFLICCCFVILFFKYFKKTKF